MGDFHVLARYYEQFDGNILAGYGNSPITSAKDFHFHDYYEIFPVSGSITGISPGKYSINF